MTRRKFAALIICALFAVFVFSSFSLVVVHSHAHCNHLTCPICKTIQRTDALLRQLYAGFVVALTAALARFVLAPVPARGFFLSHPTLVSMKVKLTD